jgi:hypothetical protein
MSINTLEITFPMVVSVSSESHERITRYPWKCLSRRAHSGRIVGKPEMWLFLPPWRLFPSDVSALSEARFQEKVRTSTVLRRAFDKAVRRKPPAVAADAGPMQIQLWRGGCGGAPELCGRARQTTPGDEKATKAQNPQQRQGLRK